jgi:hypothetical protein
MAWLGRNGETPDLRTVNAITEYQKPRYIWHGRRLRKDFQTGAANLITCGGVRDEGASSS